MKILIAAASALLATAAAAAPVAVLSYDTPNGDGQAIGGVYNYWDGTYNGAGSTTTDGAALTGGTGALTDGVLAAGPWYSVSNTSGTGPYVGWYGGATLDPVVTFHFAGSPTIGAISIQLDNSGAGGVVAPAAILVDGTSVPFTAPAAGTFGIVTLTGLHLTGASHTVEFDQPSTADWAFVGEVDFASGTVPEPAVWGLMIVGFGLVGVAARRRTGTVAA